MNVPDDVTESKPDLDTVTVYAPALRPDLRHQSGSGRLPSSGCGAAARACRQSWPCAAAPILRANLAFALKHPTLAAGARAAAEAALRGTPA